MDKVELTVLGISASTASNNAFALILKESSGDRRLPIIIGAFEAQAIALEIEGSSTRPMTHDLLKKVIEEMGEEISAVHINDLQEGTFYSQLILKNSGKEIDSRPSDAIALAVRFNCPIFIESNILEENSISMEDEFKGPEGEKPESEEDVFMKSQGQSKLQKLQSRLDKAIKEENYELAAELRDEIKRLLESS